MIHRVSFEYCVEHVCAVDLGGEVTVVAGLDIYVSGALRQIKAKNEGDVLT